MQAVYPYRNRQFNKVLQLVNTNGTAAANVFTATSVPVANVWQGQSQASLFQPSVSWQLTSPTTGLAQTGYTQGQVALSVTAAQTTGLDPAGEYRLLVDVTTGGVTSPAWEGRFKVLATPDTTSPSPPDLITYDYCESQLTDANLTDAQRDNLPYLVSAASQAVRIFCKDRYFDLRTISEKYDIELDGTVRLYQVPVLIITRVQGPQQLALTITNSSTSVQTAQAYFAFTGTPGGYATNAQTATGIVLSWVSSGVASTTTVSFTANQTISSLASAIATVGSGWTASTNTTYGAWPVTELDGGYVGQGCALGAIPGDGAQFNILADLTDTQLDNPHRGFLWVGRQYGNSNAARWGPGGDEMFGSSYCNQLGQVKVTYQAGFSVIPAEVQYFTAQLVKWYRDLARQELFLLEEKAGDYSYKISEKMLRGMPDAIREGLSPWMLKFA